jgi:deoxyguanosine kinase
MYIAIEGVIGVGKTTLARLLQPAFEAEILLEIFEENPFLSDFYGDRARYAFQTQIFFLLSRYHQQRRGVREALATNPWLLSDYTFEKDALFAEVNLEGDELEMYYRVHQALAEKITTPGLIVYLKADTVVLMQRIAQRDRPYDPKLAHHQHKRPGLRPQCRRPECRGTANPPGVEIGAVPGKPADRSLV